MGQDCTSRPGPVMIIEMQGKIINRNAITDSHEGVENIKGEKHAYVNIVRGKDKNTEPMKKVRFRDTH